MKILSGNSQEFEWVGAEGGAVVAKVEAGDAAVLVTCFGHQDVSEGTLPLRIVKLDDNLSSLEGNSDSIQATDQLKPENTDRNSPVREPLVPATALKPQHSSATSIDYDVLVHIEDIGDKRFSGNDWAGAKKKRIEGFAIFPRKGILPGQLEYQASGSRELRSRWLQGGQFCGSRGKRSAVKGFAIRMKDPRWHVAYSGSFLSGFTAPEVSDGAICCSPSAEDSLVAMKIRIYSMDASSPNEPKETKPIIPQRMRIRR